MSKSSQGADVFRSSYTKETLSTYPIADIIRKAAVDAGLKEPASRQIKHKDKKSAAVLGKCPVCNAALSYVGGNVAVCKNENCEGFAYTATDDNGEEVIKHRPVYKFLWLYSEGYIDKLFN